jgi:iron-sulfur cluster insertion protein|tara:strand:+ start:2977 stop:3324 length:348 start_codon:yes stop_codon:yes gene_type:complete
MDYMETTAVSITKNAAEKITALLAEEHSDVKMRLSVSGGGCSGFQYGFTFDDAYSSEDIIFNENGAELIVDKVSIMYLSGSIVDFEDKLMESSFKVNNPNAASSCGCGTSFAPKQ